ncbi:hypothetical protein L1987_01641 [Smallanthus sonchifolius]|uniref:Uncharacterized protein n=1 Tax=Smallanthus sonchifolius TaxID=185202 RepID=A0ACB9K5L5_9ASTR|nr:hypothetical protein L1987_01641 [Smallanthus sonchifolius]
MTQTLNRTNINSDFLAHNKHQSRLELISHKTIRCAWVWTTPQPRWLVDHVVNTAPAVMVHDNATTASTWTPLDVLDTGVVEVENDVALKWQRTPS